MFLSRPQDMYYTLNFIETLLYKQFLEQETNAKTTKSNNQKIAAFYTSFQIFIGQLFMESKQLFTGNNAERIQSNPISTDSTFYKTNLIWKQIIDALPTLEDEVDPSDFETIKKQFDHIETLFNTVITIEKKMMNDDMYFVYSEHTQYTSWSEFIEIFPSTIYFFSNSDKAATNLFPNEQPKINIKTNKI
ncbi:TPA: hypothetical protein DIC40_07365 [Patescibacteria group bacterium]|nr:hypothetical protein [Candidatus Gracilibacteria bacterium]